MRFRVASFALGFGSLVLYSLFLVLMQNARGEGEVMQLNDGGEGTYCDERYDTNTVAAFWIARTASFWMVVFGGRTDFARRTVKERGRR